MMPRKKVKDEPPVDIESLPAHKRHKKRKHKKHKRKRDADQPDDNPGSPQSEGSKPSLKLKIRIGGQTVEKNVSKMSEALDEDNANKSNDDSSQESGDEEEEAWLEALESGRLDEVDDELRKMKDPTLMTARQRALLESKAQTKEREEVPVAAQPPQMSEEMLQRRMQRAKKRKQQAEEKKEKDKKQTIERLLKKSDSRLRGRKMTRKSDTPRVSLLQRTSGTLMSFPVGVSFPLTSRTAPEYPAKKMCGIKGCPNPRRYSCSKTGLPLCSLECYKTNMLQMCV
ncbi:INO80 complex subunit B-like [Ornithodoros turicata]|uniref:Putative ino80 complex subunit b n=1 Tax=Ornithodoros turicata TaxID=34597 RepID=A0A2R5LEP8_9ACAR